MSVWLPQGTDVSIRPPRVPTLAKGPHLSGYSKGEHLVLGKSIAHDMKSGAEGAHFLGALLLTFSFDKHSHSMIILNGDDLCMTLYNPDEQLKDIVFSLVHAEGLFFYKAHREP